MFKSDITVVLVHGAWADGSSWNSVIHLLQEMDMALIAVQLPLTSVADDAAATSRIIDDIQGPILLVAHSWGGMAMTQVGVDPKVQGLVYVAAFAPDLGESGSSLIGAHPLPPALSTMVTDHSGFVYQTAEGMLANIAPDASPADAKAMAVTQKRLAGAAFQQTITAVAWKTRPTWYIASAEDRVVSYDLQTALAKRMKAKTTVLHASHMSLLSHPAEVAAVIDEAVATISNAHFV